MSMKSSKIKFPKRISKISEIRHSHFVGSTGNTVYRSDISVENGDNFTSFSPKPKDLKFEDKIEYIITNTEDGKTKVEHLEKVKNKKMKPLISNLYNVSIESLLFIDIETVRIVDKLPKKGSPLFESWAYKRRKEGETTVSQLKASYADKAALYAEFAKVVCISVGMIKPDGEVFIQSYYGDTEEEILNKFSKVLWAFVKRFSDLKICGHSIIGFDVPFLIRRFIVNSMRVPNFLNTIGEKPWTLSDKFLDVAQYWKSTGFYGASLINIAVSLGIPSPKQSIDGSQVSDVYYKGGLQDIAKYCERDVHCVINIAEHLYNREKSVTFTSKTFNNEVYGE